MTTMLSNGWRWVAFAAAMGLTGVPAGAQEFSNDPPDSPVVFGPIFLRPTIAVRDVGVDTNVLNTGEAAEDLTATLATTVEASMLMGLTRFTATTSSDYVWFQDFTDERSVNSVIGTRFEVFSPRVHPWAQVDFVRTRARPGAEIDKRAGRSEPAYAAGIDLAVGSRTRIELTARRSTTEFGANEVFQDENLAEQLNHDSDEFTASYRMELTPLTVWFVDAIFRRDRFERASFRDADDVRIMTRFAFDPTAFLGGVLALGAARFSPHDRGLPHFTGLVGEASLSYVPADSTRFTIDFNRDTDYSFDPDEPYYINTGGTLTVTRRLVGPVDVVVAGGLQELAYERRVAAPVERRDTVTTYRIGFGYRLGDTIRLGFDVERSHRRSTTEANRDYDRDRFFTSVSYVL